MSGFRGTTDKGEVGCSSQPRPIIPLEQRHCHLLPCLERCLAFRASAGNSPSRLPGNEKEPIAGRILEMPEDLEQFESRDTHSEFIAYVPPGSLAAGKALGRV